MPSVLIIDDDNQFRKLIKRFLEKDGYEVLEASNGIEDSKNLLTELSFCRRFMA